MYVYEYIDWSLCVTYWITSQVFRGT